MEIKSLLGLRKRRSTRRPILTEPCCSAPAEIQCDSPRLDQASGILGLHDPRQMRQVLARERLNCDQAGTTLSLLAFSIAEHNSLKDLSLLASVLGWRVPRIDTIGLLGTNRLGLVLPDTSISGAYAVAREALEAVAEQCEREFAYAVFVYPSHEVATRAVDDRESKI